MTAIFGLGAGQGLGSLALKLLEGRVESIHIASTFCDMGLLNAFCENRLQDLASLGRKGWAN